MIVIHHTKRNKPIYDVTFWKRKKVGKQTTEGEWETNIHRQIGSDKKSMLFHIVFMQTNLIRK